MPLHPVTRANLQARIAELDEDDREVIVGIVPDGPKSVYVVTRARFQHEIPVYETR